MMKIALVLVASLIAASQAEFATMRLNHQGAFNENGLAAGIEFDAKQMLRNELKARNPDIDLCEPCVEFAGEALQELLNLILNKAVVGSCGKLCSALVNATHNPKLGTPCTILCDLVGIKAFVNWIQKADLSPYYDCEELGVCKTNDYGDATITSWLATPSELAAGPPVTLSFTYDSKNGTSTGEIRIGVKTVDHQDLSFNSIYIADSTTGGSFKGSGQIQSTTPASPSCDPTQGTCEMWLPGVYTASIMICAGECGDTKHAHAKMYDAKNTTFTITNGPAPPSPPGPAPPPGPASDDYEDPGASGTCHTGETALQITGVTGSFCSPSCSASSPCPGAPAGAAAQGQCVLDKPPSKTPSNCALICKPGAAGQCPAKATCQSIQGTGICTYAN